MLVADKMPSSHPRPYGVLYADRSKPGEFLPINRQTQPQAFRSWDEIAHIRAEDRFFGLTPQQRQQALEAERLRAEIRRAERSDQNVTRPARTDTINVETAPSEADANGTRMSAGRPMKRAQSCHAPQDNEVEHNEEEVASGGDDDDTGTYGDRPAKRTRRLPPTRAPSSRSRYRAQKRDSRPNQNAVPAIGVQHAHVADVEHGEFETSNSDGEGEEDEIVVEEEEKEGEKGDAHECNGEEGKAWKNEDEEEEGEEQDDQEEDQEAEDEEVELDAEEDDDDSDDVLDVDHKGWQLNRGKPQPLQYKVPAGSNGEVDIKTLKYAVDFASNSDVNKAKKTRRLELGRARKRHGLPLRRASMADRAFTRENQTWIAEAHEDYATSNGNKRLPLAKLTEWYYKTFPGEHRTAASLGSYVSRNEDLKVMSKRFLVG